MADRDQRYLSAHHVRRLVSTYNLDAVRLEVCSGHILDVFEEDYA